MIDTKEMEYNIFLCLCCGCENLDMEEKYFTMKKEFNFLKKIRDRYPNMDFANTKIQITDNEKWKNFIDNLFDRDIYNLRTKGIKDYYKLLKDIYNKNILIQAQEDYKEGKITKNQLKEKINKIEDEEVQEPLTLDNITQEKVEREYTNINELDYLTKGIEYGKITIWTGVTNAGKTTMVTQFARECLLNNKKIFFFAGEQSASEFKNYLYITMCKPNEIDYVEDPHNKTIRDYKPIESKIKEFDEKFKGMIYLYDNNNKNHTLNSILKSMEYCISKGVRIFFIDNFMQIENTEKLEEQTNIMEKIKQFAMRNNIIINLVVHPRKLLNRTARLSLFDISGSQNISNKASNIISIMRTDNLSKDDYEMIKKELEKNFYDIEKCKSVIEVLKTKGNGGKMLGLNYNSENKTYEEVGRDWNINQNKTERRK